MGENNTDQDVDQIDVAVDEDSNEGDIDSQTDPEDADQADDTNTADTSKDGDEVPGEKDVEDEPPSRKPKTPADWVALRRGKKIDKMQKQPEGGDDVDEEEDDLDPQDRNAIDRRVQKHLEPLIQKEQIQELRNEINEFTAANPDFAKYSKSAEKWAQHPSWNEVPIEKIFYAIAGKDLLAIGAARRTAADEKAKHSKTGGSSPTGGSGNKPVSAMTDAEFDQEVIRTLHPNG